MAAGAAACAYQFGLTATATGAHVYWLDGSENAWWTDDPGPTRR